MTRKVRLLMRGSLMLARGWRSAVSRMETISQVAAEAADWDESDVGLLFEPFGKEPPQ